MAKFRPPWLGKSAKSKREPRPIGNAKPQNPDRLAYLVGERMRSVTDLSGMRWDRRKWGGFTREYIQHEGRVGVVVHGGKNIPVQARIYDHKTSKMLHENNFDDYDSARKAVRMFVKMTDETDKLGAAVKEGSQTLTRAKWSDIK